MDEIESGGAFRSDVERDLLTDEMVSFVPISFCGIVKLGCE